MAFGKKTPQEVKPQEPAPAAGQTELQRAMGEVGIMEADLDTRPGQKGIVDHGDRIVFHCFVKLPDGRMRNFEKTWRRP